MEERSDFRANLSPFRVLFLSFLTTKNNRSSLCTPPRFRYQQYEMTLSLLLGSDAGAKLFLLAHLRLAAFSLFSHYFRFAVRTSVSTLSARQCSSYKNNKSILELWKLQKPTFISETQLISYHLLDRLAALDIIEVKQTSVSPNFKFLDSFKFVEV